MTLAIDLATSVLELAEDRDAWRRRALKAEEENLAYAEHFVAERVAGERQMLSIFAAALDPNNGIDRAARALQRDPLKGAAK